MYRYRHRYRYILQELYGDSLVILIGRRNVGQVWYYRSAKRSQSDATGVRVPRCPHFSGSFVPGRLNFNNSFKQWYNMLDILLLKEENNFTMKKIRTIGLMEADYQLNNKWLSKLITANNSRHHTHFQLNAPEQYGAKNYHRVQEVTLHEQLIYSILHMTKRPAGMVSLDAETCFDRMCHHVVSICLQRAGIPLPSIYSTLSTIQQATHYVRTAFGDSTIGYSGTKVYPLQGFPQGHGMGPCGFQQITTPQINIARKNNAGFYHTSPISKEEIHITALVFFDDSKFIHTSPNYLTIDTITQSTQEVVDVWQSSLAAT